MKIYRGEDGDTKPVEMECEELGYPGKTTCGETMFDNTHFETEKQAWESIWSSVGAGVSLAGAAVARAKNSLLEEQKRAADAAVMYGEARKGYLAFRIEKRKVAI